MGYWIVREVGAYIQMDTETRRFTTNSPLPVVFIPAVKTDSDGVAWYYWAVMGSSLAAVNGVVNYPSYVESYALTINGKSYYLKTLDHGAFEAADSTLTAYVKGVAETYAPVSSSSFFCDLTSTTASNTYLIAAAAELTTFESTMNKGIGLITPGGALTRGKLRLADATVADVLYGKKFYSGNKVLKTGEMSNRSGWTGTYSGSNVTVPKGYHDGTGYVTVAGGNQGAWTSSISAGSSIAIPQGYHDGSGYVSSPAVSVSLLEYNLTARATALSFSRTYAAGSGYKGFVVVIVGTDVGPYNNSISSGTISAQNLYSHQGSETTDAHYGYSYVISNITLPFTMSFSGSTSWHWGYSYAIYGIQ